MKNIRSLKLKKKRRVSSRSHHKRYFSMKLTQNAPTAAEWNRKPRGKSSFQEAIVTTEGIRVSFTNENRLQ